MSDPPSSPESQSYSRRRFLRTGAMGGFAGLGGYTVLGPNQSESDRYYSQHRESDSSATGGGQLDASSTAQSLTGEASVEMTTKQCVDWQGDESRLVDIELRSVVAINGHTAARTRSGVRPESSGNTGAVVTKTTYESVGEASDGFTQFQIEFDQYPFWTVTHSVFGTINLEGRTIQLDVEYAHSGEEFGTIE